MLDYLFGISAQNTQNQAKQVYYETFHCLDALI